MKKKIFGGIAIVAIAVAVAFNVSVSNQKSDKASLLALVNVEVLAQSEGVSYAKEPEWIDCIITEVVVGIPIVINGVKFPVGATYTINGTKKACTFWIFSSCSHDEIKPCQKIV